VKAVVGDVVAELGRLDVIVNNAGVMPIRPLQECNTEEWDAMVDINIKGVLYGIAAALPVFVKQNGGQFINMGSIPGVKVFAPGGTVYSSTKFAVRAISDGLRLEVGPKIRVCCIEPGSICNLRDGATGPAIAQRLASAGVSVIFTTADPQQIPPDEVEVAGLL